MDTETDTRHAALDAAIAALNLTLSAEFVPQSQSRNAGERLPSINWRLTLSRPGLPDRYALTCDYMQGIAHAPGCGQYRRTMADAERDTRAAERGEFYPGKTRDSFVIGWRKLPGPALRDVLYSICSDASVLDSPSFETWAAEMGEAIDSRSAERCYQECLRHALALRALIGDAALANLRELYQDY